MKTDLGDCLTCTCVPTYRFLKTASSRERHENAITVVQLLGQISFRRLGVDSEQYEENPEEAGFNLMEPESR